MLYLDCQHDPVSLSRKKRVYPNNCKYCIQLYPKLRKCVSRVYPNFFFICSPTHSVSQSFVPLQLFPRHDEAIICEAGSYSSGYASAYPTGDGQDVTPFFHGFHVSHVYPKVCILCASQSKNCVSCVDVDTHYLHLCAAASQLKVCVKRWF